MRHPSTLALVLISLALAAALGACTGTSNTTPSPTGDAAVSASPAATSTVDPGPLATRAASSPAAALSAVLFADGDLPADMKRLPSQPKILKPQDIPGLIDSASEDSITIVSDDRNEFVTEIGVILDAGDPQTLLDAFSLKSYLSGFTGGASDATGSTLALPAAPPGAKGVSYSGTVRSAGQTHRVEGEAVAFVQAGVFVLLVHGRYVPATRAIDLGALATAIAGRLASTTR